MLVHLVEAFTRSDQFAVNKTFDDFIFSNGMQTFTLFEPLHADFHIKRLAKDEFEIKGKVGIGLILPCDLCTKEVKISMNVDFHRSVSLQNEEDSNFIEGASFNVEEFLHEELIEELPQKVLCSDDCKGLCEQCGQDLNEQECSCEKGHIDIRMAHLKDLFDNKFKEV